MPLVAMCMPVSYMAATVITPSSTTDSMYYSRVRLSSDVYPGMSVLPDSLSGDAEECVKWLYAYMQTPDITGYSPGFFISNVLASLHARENMPWGKSVPEREFKHFVLPVRVNNENLDMSREVFYDELRDRVGSLSMKEAIKEINHWCHEKVTYQPSDARTSSPLSSVNQAIGRCGEESTFTVAALRAMGIPARQVYTPRWAHTDDNHAWVEAWADGRWYFLGACEPAPELDMAWFNAPASRGMLMTTNVFGPYDGPEECIKSHPLLTTINVTSNYAPVGEARVRVVNQDGTPVEGAQVNFCIYNYADFYPAVTKVSDKHGKASLTCGMGDVIAWANDGKCFGFAKVNPKDKEIRTLVLDKDSAYTGCFDFDIVPPRQSGTLPVASGTAEARNNGRLAYEDSIRGAYVSTFFNPLTAEKEAERCGFNPERTAQVLVEARGNGKRISDFLMTVPDNRKGHALDLLCAVSEKDRRDITESVLRDNLDNTPVMDSPLWVDYVLNPRVENECLVPYKAFFRGKIDPVTARRYRDNPAEFAKWTAANILTDSTGNPSGLRMDPRAVWCTAIADPRSRSIFFVSVARSLGIPARIDPVTAKTQYAGKDGNWVDVTFGESVSDTGISRAGKVRIGFIPQGRLTDPKYYSQFSISQINGCVPRQLEYPEGATLGEIAHDPLPLDEGHYLLLSGRRMADGSVLSHGEIFRIHENETSQIPLTIRKDDNSLSVIGALNAENIYTNPETGEDRNILSTTGRGYYVVAFLKPGDEPSAHILNDLIAARKELEKCGNRIMILLGDIREWPRFNPSTYDSLPSTSVFGVDKKGKSLAELAESLNLETTARPIVAVADTFNRVVFAVQGYTIGIGERLAEVLDSLR